MRWPLLLLGAHAAAAAARGATSERTVVHPGSRRKFVHPGVLIDAAQLAFAAKQASADMQPFAETLETLKKDTWTTNRNASMSPGWNGSIGCGYFGHPDFGCGNETGDAQAALMDAMLWAYTKDPVWAAKSIGIMDFYAQHLKQYENWGNGKLQAAWSADKWARAAEIISSTGAGWPASDAKAFGDMLQVVSVPMLWNGSCFNGNWELSMIEGMMGIAVFTENATLFDHSVEMWKARIPAYFYLSAEDGDQPVGLAACPSKDIKQNWHGQTVFSSKVDGVCQETCRDFGHTQFGVASTFNAAETALIQGVDLYATHAPRLAAMMEFHTGFLTAGAAAGWPCVTAGGGWSAGCNPYHFTPENITDVNVCGGKRLGLGYMPATWQIGLTALRRSGYKQSSLPHTTKYVTDFVQPLSGKDHDACDGFMCCFEALTHGAWHSPALRTDDLAEGIAIAAAAQKEAVLGTGSLKVRASPPGPPSLLPQFQQLADFAQAETIGFQHFGNKGTNIARGYNASTLCKDPKRPHDVCSPPGLDITCMDGEASCDDAAHSTRYLPHLLMNQYRAERAPTEMPTITLSDDELRIDVTPQFGGKVYAMTDVPTGKSMLHSPNVRQAVQSARLSAQVDGGIEWNYMPGLLGHWVGTERDVWAAKLKTSKGPMLRIYEFDRFNETYFQVDMLVRGGTLFAHPKLFNPHQHNLTGYWWACSGLQFTVPSDATQCSDYHKNTFQDGTTCCNCQSKKGHLGTRVLSPATDEVDDSLEREPWPHQAGKGGNPANVTKDMSWLSNWVTGDDNFIRIAKPEKPHITVVDKDLYGDAVGLFHGE